MGWRFRKSFSLGKGVRINVSQRGIGMSVGGKGFRVGVNSKGIYTSTSIPGTGLYRIDYLSKAKKKQSAKNSSLSNYPNEITVPQITSVDPLPTPPELLAGTGKGCLWTIVSLILLAWQPLLGIVSILFQVAFYFKNSKSPQKLALKHFNLGKAAYQKQDYQAALDNFLQTLELMPNIKSLNLTIADLYLRLEDYQNAISFLEKYLEDNPQDNAAKIKLANALAHNEEYNKALKVLQDLPADLKNQLNIINAIAICFMKLNKFDLALEVLEGGPLLKRKMDEDMKLFRYLLGVCYKEVGNKAKAVKQLKKVYAADINYLDVEEQLKELGEL